MHEPSESHRGVGTPCLRTDAAYTGRMRAEHEASGEHSLLAPGGGLITPDAPSQVPADALVGLWRTRIQERSWRCASALSQLLQGMRRIHRRPRSTAACSYSDQITTVCKCVTQLNPARVLEPRPNLILFTWLYAFFACHAPIH